MLLFEYDAPCLQVFVWLSYAVVPMIVYVWLFGFPMCFKLCVASYVVDFVVGVVRKWCT